MGLLKAGALGDLSHWKEGLVGLWQGLFILIEVGLEDLWLVLFDWSFIVQLVEWE